MPQSRVRNPHFRRSKRENAHVMMSLEDSNITFVLSRYEQSEAFIVDA